jgi:hypothetical protein
VRRLVPFPDASADSFDVVLAPQFDAKTQKLLGDLFEAGAALEERQRVVARAMRQVTDGLSRQMDLTVRETPRWRWGCRTSGSPR